MVEPSRFTCQTPTADFVKIWRRAFRLRRNARRLMQKKEVYKTIGHSCIRAGKYDEAIRNFSHAIELDPEDVAAYTMRGSVYAKAGQHDAAITDFNRAIELNPSDATAYRHKVGVYVEIGEIDAARADYEKIVELDPVYADILSCFFT